MPHQRWSWPPVNIDDAEAKDWVSSLNAHPIDQEPWRDIPEGRGWSIPSNEAGAPPRATGTGPDEAREAMLRYCHPIATGQAPRRPKAAPRTASLETLARAAAYQ